MKHALLALAILAASTVSFAHETSPPKTQTPTPGTGSNTANGGAGGNAAAVAAALAAAKAQAAAQATIKGNTLTGGAGGLGGAGGTATSNSGGNTLTGGAGGASNSGGNQITTGGNSVTFEGAQAGSGGITSTVYEKSAPSVAIGAPQQPLTSCRLAISLGGSSTSGSGAGGIPIGNDETCLAAARLALMERVGGFTAEDKLRTVCGVEGMASLSRCKALDAPKVAEAPNAAPAPVSQAMDPIIAASGRTYPSQPVSVRPFFGFAGK